MRVIPFLAVLVLAMATPAMAQYQPYQTQPPNLGGVYQQSIDTIRDSGNNGYQPPSYDVRLAPQGGYTISRPPSYGAPSIACCPGPLGGQNCQ
jgi:hypothetical protein